MPSVSAKSWAIYEIKQKKLIYGKRMFKKREIASLTKIMNLITILELM
jgi:D-alanyl-D-alanine carboxypeptidase